MDKKTYEKMMEVDRSIRHMKANFDPKYSGITGSLIDFLDRTVPYEWDAGFDDNKDDGGVTVFMPVRVPGPIMDMIKVIEDPMDVNSDKLIQFLVKKIFHEGLVKLVFQAMKLTPEIVDKLRKATDSMEDEGPEETFKKIERLAEILRKNRSHK